MNTATYVEEDIDAFRLAEALEKGEVLRLPG